MVLSEIRLWSQCFDPYHTAVHIFKLRGSHYAYLLHFSGIIVSFFIALFVTDSCIPLEKRCGRRRYVLLRHSNHFLLWFVAPNMKVPRVCFLNDSSLNLDAGLVNILGSYVLKNIQQVMKYIRSQNYNFTFYYVPR